MTRTLSDWLIRFGSFGLVAMTAIIGWQVFGRYALQFSPSWTEQASLVLMIWYVMFGAAAGVYEGFHIRIALLDERLGERAVTVRRLVAAIVAVLGAILLIYGVQMCWLVRTNVIPSLGISRSLAYVPLPVSGFLMVVFAIPRIVSGAPYADEGVD
ncbi:TRAP transporter small permease [Altericroceibacterium xinjiangense]|uniref:TRAP transporter small permease n=1 Tax=Altericroceibacterium xinjiangense TaxID=762261 RepID=UPI000F7D7CA2|nr:TRAP transporter small permease [Altericroceibacterium xinjiangense]